MRWSGLRGEVHTALLEGARLWRQDAACGGGGVGVGEKSRRRVDGGGPEIGARGGLASGGAGRGNGAILAARRLHKAVALLVHQHAAVGAAVARTPEAPYAIGTPGALGAMVEALCLKQVTVHVV